LGRETQAILPYHSVRIANSLENCHNPAARAEATYRPRAENRAERSGRAMRGALRWALGLGIAVLVTVVPIVFFRYEYTTSKRFREIAPGALYRGGQMSADGFVAVFARYGIRTVINVQDDYPDPDLWLSFFDRR